MTTTIALVTARVFVLASGTRALHESISEKSITGFTMELFHGLGQHVALRFNF